MQHIKDNMDEWVDTKALRARLELRMDGSALQNVKLMGWQQFYGEDVASNCDVSYDDVSFIYSPIH